MKVVTCVCLILLLGMVSLVFAEAPTDPFGERYFIDAHGKAATPSDSKRLRLAPNVTRGKP